ALFNPIFILNNLLFNLLIISSFSHHSVFTFSDSNRQLFISFIDLRNSLRSIPSIFFLSLQFSNTFNVSSNSFDNSVVSSLKSFLLINLFNVFCSLFVNSTTFILELLFVQEGKKNIVVTQNKINILFLVALKYYIISIAITNY